MSKAPGVSSCGTRSNAQAPLRPAGGGPGPSPLQPGGPGATAPGRERASRPRVSWEEPARAAALTPALARPAPASGSPERLAQVAGAAGILSLGSAP